MASASGALVQVLGYGAFAALCLVLGTLISVTSAPSAAARNSAQHLAAGCVFAAAGVEVLPDVLHRGLPVAAALGFALGVAVMIGIEAGSRKLEAGGVGGRGGNWSFVVVLAVDLLIDGVLIGVTGAAGSGRASLLIAAALAVELLALGLSAGVAFRELGGSRARPVWVAGFVALAPVAGALGGYLLAGGLTAGWMEGVLAFAVAALLYLAAEELLKEAHETPETTLTTVLFFAGFLAILVIDMAAKSAG